MHELSLSKLFVKMYLYYKAADSLRYALTLLLFFSLGSGK